MYMHNLKKRLKQINKPHKIGLYIILSNRNDAVTGGLRKIFFFYFILVLTFAKDWLLPKFIYLFFCFLEIYFMLEIYQINFIFAVNHIIKLLTLVMRLKLSVLNQQS